jgi:hypothetical protein
MGAAGQGPLRVFDHCDAVEAPCNALIPIRIHGGGLGRGKAVLPGISRRVLTTPNTTCHIPEMSLESLRESQGCGALTIRSMSTHWMQGSRRTFRHGGYRSEWGLISCHEAVEEMLARPAVT